MDGMTQGLPAHPAARPPVHGPLRRWVTDHESSWLFTLLYVGLAVALSLFVSLFWLVVLVVVHFLMEFVALEAQHPPLRQRAARALWEVKLDVALLVFALVLSLYLETLFGILGLRSAAQVGAAVRATGRFATLERIVRGVLLSLDDAAYVAKAFLMRRPAKDRQARRQAKQDVHAARKGAKAPNPDVAPWLARWSTGDRISAAIFAIGLALVLAAPWLTHYDYGSTAARIAQDLDPFP